MPYRAVLLMEHQIVLLLQPKRNNNDELTPEHNSFSLKFNYKYFSTYSAKNAFQYIPIIDALVIDTPG